jgi:gamma-glutamylcysteine synthetase
MRLVPGLQPNQSKSFFEGLSINDIGGSFNNEDNEVTDERTESSCAIVGDGNIGTQEEEATFPKNRYVIVRQNLATTRDNISVRRHEIKNIPDRFYIVL